MKFCQGMNEDDPKVDLKGQGHQVKNVILASLDSLSSLVVIIKGFLGQGQSLYGSRSKVTWLKVSLRLMIFGRWAHINVKLLHFLHGH